MPSVNAVTRAALAEKLKCRLEDIKPCLAALFKPQPERFAADARLRFAARGFVGLELKVLAASSSRLQSVLREWGQLQGNTRAEIDQYLRYLGRTERGPRLCNTGPYPLSVCCGKQQCPYYRAKPWEKDTPPKDSDLGTFAKRRWPEQLRSYELKMYSALCRDEQLKGIRPGKPVFTSSRDARALARMNETYQRKALEGLQDRGLVKVLDWGMSDFTAARNGKKGRSRSVVRVVPIPYP